jgi:hypothetical protein
MTFPMWPELVRELQRFPDAVLTGLDPTGSPVSVRRRLRPDPARRHLRCPRAAGVELVAGPASLLCHRHDERLWRLRSFAVHGSLTEVDDEWVFTPSRLVAGVGMGGPLGDLRGFVAARRRAGRYLRRHRLARPRVPWARYRHRAARASE